MKNQEYQGFELIVCVNQYDDWWKQPEKLDQCINNQESIEFLKNDSNLKIHIIDKSSEGNGWPAKKGGVGWARKVAMDYISKIANPEDIIICIDADTFYPPNFAGAVLDKISRKENLLGLAIPYYHPLTGNPVNDRLILRYEIYMRHYLLNMLEIGNPYAFTAIGSAMASTVTAYRKIGGLTPVKSGEDFYFIQKLKKTGKVANWCETIAYPSSRFSDRVIFGTGPALIKGNTGDWASYPIYKKESFRKMKETFDLFPDLFEKNIPTPMDSFLQKQFKAEKIWEPLRLNYKDRPNFVKACANKVDGLRILQFLRNEQFKNETRSDEEILFEFLSKAELKPFF
ncbi:MAG TPA: hypothetical protein VIN10_09275, partial [Bacteroidales bacterium]